MAAFGGQKQEKVKILAQKQLVLIEDVKKIRILKFRRFFTHTAAAAAPDVCMAFLMAMKIQASTLSKFAAAPAKVIDLNPPNIT